MWLRQYSVHEILSLREGRQCSLLLRLVLNASRRQVLHASHMRKPHLGRGQTNYYQVLDIAPKATQAQVKDAYYSLSKKYHPDHYKGDEDPSVKFREIKEAYEILGNFSQRKMYDKGLLGVSAAATPAEAEQYSAKFYESRRKRGAVPSASGRTPIYNFDEWSKYHYDSSRMRRGHAKMKYDDLLKERVAEAELRKAHSMISVLLLFGIMLLIQYSRSQRYDSEKTKSK